jgi:ATP synthase protein I
LKVKKLNVMTDPEGREFRSKPTDLEALSAKLDAINSRKTEAPDTSQNPSSNMAQGFKYASEFSAAVLVGSALGWAIDYFIGTAPWGLVVGLILGFCAGVMNVVRAAREGMDGSGEDLPLGFDEDEDA